MPPTKNGKAPPEPGPWDWAKVTEPSQIGSRELIKAYRLDYKECPLNCRRPCKKNPFCLCGLGDKHWKKEDGVEDDQSINPNRDEGQIAGIQNLGATCYVNSLLQLWFHNPILRPAILKWKPPTASLTNSEAVSQLQAMFARLKMSKQSAIDPRPFVTALKLDDQVQQDAQEFSKLLLAVIMEILQQDEENHDIFNTFKDCFTGQSQYETVCDRCAYRSATPPEDFNELQLPVQKRLRDSFQEYLKPSVLDGDNKYYCPKCLSKQEATRGMKLLSLPPVLNLQLMRFVYDIQSGDRKKVQKSIEFPEVLDMTEFLSPENPGGDERILYQLNAVLIHRGRRVSSGHYIAHIKDIVSGVWFECNDASIEQIDRKGYSKNLVMHDEEEDPKESNSKPASADKTVPSTSDKKAKDPAASGDPKDKKPGATNNPTSTGAYMLVYTQVKYFQEQPADPEIPADLVKLITEEDLKFEEEFNRTKAEKDLEIKKKLDRQSEVDMLFKGRAESEKGPENVENRPQQNGIRTNTNVPETKNISSRGRPLQNAEDMEVDPPVNGSVVNNMDFVAVEWLEKWLDPKITDPPEIMNVTILCNHTKLKPPNPRDSSVLYKVVPVNFAERIYDKYKGIRLAGEAALCLECVQAHCKMIRQLQQLDQDFLRVQELIKKSDETFDSFKKSGRSLSPQFMSDKVIIGKESTRNWKRYARNIIEQQNLDMDDCLELTTSEFNQDVECSHGRLDPNSVGTRKLISLDAWSIITKYFDNAILYAHCHEQCQDCCKTNNYNLKVKEQNKKLAQKQKQLLAPLYSGKNRPNEHLPGEYYVVPTKFIEEWRQFIRDPDTNDSIMTINTSALLCDCQACGCTEPRLKYPIDIVQKARNENPDTGNIIALIREDEMAVFLGDLTSLDREIKLYIDIVNTCLSYSYNIGICRTSANEWLTDITNRALEYEDGEIYIKKIEDGEQFLMDEGREDDEEHVPAKKERRDMPIIVRRSNRPRHTRDEHKFPINSRMRIVDFQKKLTQEYTALKSDQHLYFNHKELTAEDKQKTFGELKISSGTTLLLVVDPPNSNYLDSDADKPTRPEQGFTGTLLAASSFRNGTGSDPLPPPPPSSNGNGGDGDWNMEPELTASATDLA